MIVDLEGFGMKELLQPGMDLILKVMAFEEANYPETLKVCFVINGESLLHDYGVMVCSVVIGAILNFSSSTKSFPNDLESG